MSSPPSRKAPLQVLHLSMPRTGSLSMAAAYQILGMTTYHGFDYVERPADQIKWEAAIDAKFYGKGRKYEKKDFDRLDFLGGFEALSDFPVVGFREELLEWYPEAKVVLVERDVDKWYASFETAVIDNLYTWKTWILMHLIEPYFLKARIVTTMAKLEHHMFNCHDQASFKANAKKTYLERNEWVKKNVPKERLLVYELGSGWEPLCTFLGKEVPAEPFPWKNEGVEFAIWMKKLQTELLISGLITAGKILAVPGAAVLVGWLVVKSGWFA